MKIINPATGAVLAEVAADNLKTVRAKYDLARAAQAKWAAVPIKKRLAIIARFRELLIERQDVLARTLTAEVGKPIRQSRNELNGLASRIDFFLAETERALREQRVFADPKGKLEERIAHVPLGVIANISAWNYPYFVGGNVFVPALIAALISGSSRAASATEIRIPEGLAAIAWCRAASSACGSWLSGPASLAVTLYCAAALLNPAAAVCQYGRAMSDAIR